MMEISRQGSMRRPGARAALAAALALILAGALAFPSRVLAQQAPPAGSPPAPSGAPAREAAREAPVALRKGDTFYAVVRGRRGAVAAGNAFTTQAGFRVLLAGGNAVDSGVAMVLAGAMTEFDSFGFGGEVPILIYLAEPRKVVAINGVGFAPEAVKADLFDPAKGIPAEGPLSAVVPSVLDNCVLALARFGSKSFCEVSAPARELAEGFPMLEGLARRIAGDADGMRLWPSSTNVFLPGGRPPSAGEVFVQKDLAATLRSLCEAEKRAAPGGRDKALRAVRDEFYRGPLGREFARGARAAGGILSEKDLEAFEARLEEPVSAAYGEYVLYKPGYWTQGPALLHTLGLLSGFDLKALGHNSADYVHLVTEAMKLAFADRDAYFADPDFVRVPARGFLSEAYIRERARLIDMGRASLEQRPGDPWKYDKAATGASLPGSAGAKVVLAAAGPASEEAGQADAARRAGPGVTLAAAGGASGGALPGDLPRPGVSIGHDTTSMEAVDARGNLFSATASGAWLPSVIAGATGIPMSERLEAFRLDAGHPNVLAPRKRPRITLTPTIVLKAGKPWMALSTVGGDYQDQVILQVFLNLVVFGMNVQQAIEAPKFTTDHLVNSFAGHVFEAGSLNLEERLYADAALVKALEARGHKIASTGSWTNGTAPTAILYDPASGVMEAGADPRHHRHAIAW
jgi:gamma-glutamyltranspeptidase/glutathione hydrolase